MILFYIYKSKVPICPRLSVITAPQVSGYPLSLNISYNYSNLRDANIFDTAYWPGTYLQLCPRRHLLRGRL